MAIVSWLASSPRGVASESTEINQLALSLTDRFYDDLAPDNAALAGFLGDGFQIIGSDGLRSDRKSGMSPTSGSGGGAEGNRTPDLCSAIAALSHLSYGPGKVGVI